MPKCLLTSARHRDRPERSIGMRQRQVPALGVHDVETELIAQAPEKRDKSS